MEKEEINLEPKFSAVVPVYQSEDCLVRLYDELSNSLSKISGNFEIIFVDDGSTDRSWEVLLELQTKDAKVKCIRFPKNYGHVYAITAGLESVPLSELDEHWVVVLDCDLQDPPTAICELYKSALETRHKIVFAARINREDPRLKLILGDLFFMIFGRIAGFPVDRRVGNFFLVHQNVLDKVKTKFKRLCNVTVLMAQSGFAYKVVPVAQQPRFAGTSSYNVWKSFKLGVAILFSHGRRPRKNLVLVNFISLNGNFPMGIYPCSDAFHSWAIDSGLFSK